MLLCLKKTFTCLEGRSVLGCPARRVISRVGPGCYCLEVWCGLGMWVHPPTSELAQIKALLENLDWKISKFQQILPKTDPRRGMINFVGSVLKSLFGIATVADAHKLHESLKDLQASYLDVAHSLSNQLTYIKNLTI